MRKPFLVPAICAAALCAQTAAPPRPAVPALRPYKLPVYSETKLPNGMNVILLQDDRFPLVTARLIFAGGSRRDPKDAQGVAAAVGALLLRGTQSRSARQFAEDLDSIGCQMTVTAKPDAITVEATAIAESTGSLLVLISDILRSVEFPERELDQYRRGRGQTLRAEAGQPATIAAKILGTTLFGPNQPGAVDPPPEAVEALERQQVLEYRDSNFVPNNTTLIMIGKLPAHADLMKAVTYVFGNWQDKKLPPYAAPKLPEAKRRLMLVDRPGLTLAEIRVARVAPGFGNAELLPVQMASAVVGGGPDSRLARELHDVLKPGEEVHTEVNALADAGAFTAVARVRNEVAGDVLGKILAQLDRISTEPVDGTELADAKSRAIGAFLIGLESQQTLADMLTMAKLANAPKDYVEGYAGRVNALDAAKIQAAAKKWLATDNAVVVVVADAAKVRDQLEKIGAFESVGTTTPKP